MVLSRGFSLVLGLLVAACGIAGARAVRPAGSTLSPAVAGPTEAPTKVEASSRGRSGGKPLDLTDFRPLLVRIEHEKVRALLDDGQLEEAIQALVVQYKQMPADPQGAARIEYLQGSLFRASGQGALAEQKFDAAAQCDWPLKEDALLAKAELQLAAKNAPGALVTLGKLTTLSQEARALLASARAYEEIKDAVGALASYSALLGTSHEAEAHLGIARVHLVEAEQAAASEARSEAASAAANQAELARVGLPPEGEVATDAAVLIARARSLGAKVNSLSLELRLAHLRGLIDSRDFDAADVAAASMSVPSKPLFSPELCQFDYLRGKLLAAHNEWGAAADRIVQSAGGCTSDPELHASLLFNAGKYSAADGRHTKAIQFFDDLQARYPDSNLSDDARLRAAKSYLKAGMNARFVTELSRMPEDYPEGDMTKEGVLDLALYLMERDDWSGASQVLERAATIVRQRDSARGHEFSGTERYFLARCLQKLGKEQEALKEYESIVIDVPLSYYMLHAYSRLLDASPARARAALEEGLKRAQELPFEFPYRPEYDSPEFRRGMELLVVGETDEGAALLSRLGLSEGADDALLWGIALLHDRAGDAHRSHQIARGRLSDWFAHYPAGDWNGPWEIGFPRPYHSIVQKESQATGVPEWFIYGVMREESTFMPHVVSHANAYGLMQIIPPTARGIGMAAGLPYSPEALKKPPVNIAIGSRVLENLGRRFKKNPWLAIPGYNAGPGRPARWLRERPNVDFDVWVETIPFRETRRYTKRVLASRAAYAFVYYRQDAQTALVLPERLTVN